jgi:hypothetical protein
MLRLRTNRFRLTYGIFRTAHLRIRCYAAPVEYSAHLPALPGSKDQAAAADPPGDPSDVVLLRWLRRDVQHAADYCSAEITQMVVGLFVAAVVMLACEVYRALDDPNKRA